MMMKTIRIAVLLGLIATMLQAQDQLVLRVFDVEGATRNELESPGLQWGLAIREAYRAIEGDSDSTSEEDDERFDTGADMLVRMLRDSVDPSSWELEGRFMRLNETGTRIFVRQTPANLDKVATFLTMQASVQARSVKLEALILAGGAAELAGLGGNRHIVSSERFDRIRAGTAGMAILATMSGSVRDGQRLLLRGGRMQHFLALQGAQIAQTAALTEPREGKVFAGSEVLVRPLYAPDGRINLRVQARLGSALSLEDWQVRSPGVGPLQLPSMRQSLFSSTVMLSSGEAVVLGAIGSGDGQARFLLLRAISSGQPDTGFSGPQFPLQAYRCGYLISSFLSMPRLDLGHLGGGGRIYDEVEREDAVFGSGYDYLSPESIMDLVRQTVTPEFWDESRYLLEPESTRLWLAAGQEQHQGVASLIRGLAEQRARFHDVEAFCLKIDRAQLAAIRKASAGDWLRALLRSPQALRLHAMVGSVEVGSRIEFAEGIEKAWVAENDADVAQGADILAPAVETGFRGLYLRLAPYPLGPDKIGLDFEYDLIGPEFELGVVGEGGGSAGDLRMAAAGWASGRGHAVAAAGQYHLLAEATADSPDASLLLIVRLR